MEIKTLVQDIYSKIQDKGGWFNEEVSNTLRNNLCTTLASNFNGARHVPGSGSLRMSGMGPKCPRALWYEVNSPELAEPVPPWAEIKFAYGHILEALALTLAKASGHEVTGEQDELVLDGIVGHRDAVIDGCVVDVKSCTSHTLREFKNKQVNSWFTIGYLDQLSGYVVSSDKDPLVRVKDRGYILAIDKTLGHMVLYEHKITDQGFRIKERIRAYKRIVGNSSPPPCECATKPYGTSGNIALAVPASYSPFKHCCFPQLRTFLYSDGPVYFTKVVVKPAVPEITKQGENVSYVH